MKTKLIDIWNPENTKIVKSPCNDMPYMSCHIPESPNGTAVLVLPGGGYLGVCDTYEGEDVADYFNSFGVTAFVLRYRIAPKFLYPAPMCDAIQAMAYIRHFSYEYNIKNNQIGIMGFSAGGHLASVVSTLWNNSLYAKTDLLKDVSSRPNFAVLTYPVINLNKLTAYEITGLNLLGADADPDLIASLCSECNVTPNTPPTFLFHTFEDNAVPCENSIQYYLAMRRNNIPGELHIYKEGAHGMGLALDNKTLFTWPGLLKNWVLNLF